MSSDGQGSVSPPRDADDNRGVKNKFSGNLKHELRTPLHHIIGYCEMLMEQAQEAAGRREVGRPAPGRAAYQP